MAYESSTGERVAVVLDNVCEVTAKKVLGTSSLWPLSDVDSKAKSKYRNRIRLERAPQKQSGDTHKTPYDRVKRCQERKINVKESERVNIDVFTPRSAAADRSPVMQSVGAPPVCDAADGAWYIVQVPIVFVNPALVCGRASGVLIQRVSDSVAPLRSARRTKINLNFVLSRAFWRFRRMISDQVNANPGEGPPTSGIVRHDSHLLKSGDSAGIEPSSPWWEASHGTREANMLIAQPQRPPLSLKG
ncbi:hypothetical protein PR048_024328 [Dryococelus australis]|uniref:Uncharacterized protein n=1 Tax=Dryococelus australis TaxID=614101 RepID=A0ABQ9GN97_9NEOP|nr:hypothetical protein PR048_024328 [Dryococelus australis]